MYGGGDCPAHQLAGCLIYLMYCPPQTKPLLNALNSSLAAPAASLL